MLQKKIGKYCEADWKFWNKIYMVRLVKFCHEFFILYDDVFFICLGSIVRYMSIKRSLEMCNISWDMPIKENPVKAIYKRTISVYIYIDWNKL